jgi:hypothetical protein
MGLAAIINFSPNGAYPTCYYGHAEMMDRYCSGSACACGVTGCWADISHYECTYDVE